MMWHEATAIVSPTLDDAKTYICDALDLSDHEYVGRPSFGSS